MGSFSAMHWMVLVGVGVLLFGRGAVMAWAKDIGHGISEWRKGTSEIENTGNMIKRELTDAGRVVTDEARQLDRSLRG